MSRFPLLGIVLVFAITPLSAQDDQGVIKVDSNLVILNASITDTEGKPVSGLQKNGFTVFENGVEQKIEFFSAGETSFAAAILLDTSGSMEDRVSMARSAAIKFLEGLRGTDTAAVYRFDSKVEKVQEFSESRDLDERAFDLKSGGMTVLNDAIFLAAEELAKRSEKRRAIVVLSDGEDTRSRKSAENALKAALAADAVIYTVDMSAVSGGRRIQNVGALKNFAEKTGGRFIKSPGGAALREAFSQIVAELGTQYTIAYEPSNTIKDGKWREIELKVAKKDFYIRTRKGYHAPKSAEARAK